MPPGAELDEIARALDQLLRLSAGRKVHARLAAAAGTVVSPPGLLLLLHLRRSGPLSLGALADACRMDRAATGRQVRDLEHDGLVERRVDAGDARVTIVRLTRSGAATERRLARVRQQHLVEVVGPWSSADRKAFARLLGRLVDDLRSVPYRPVTGEVAAG